MVDNHQLTHPTTTCIYKEATCIYTIVYVNTVFLHYRCFNCKNWLLCIIIVAYSTMLYHLAV